MKYIIANWKMNMNLQEVENWLSDFSNLLEGKSLKNKILLAGAFPHLKVLSEFCSAHSLFCSSQDVSFYNKGAHTGDVGAFQLKGHCQFCVVGHSEREESRSVVVAKRDACLQEELTPIVCFTKKEEWEENYTKGALLAWEDPDNISREGTYRNKDPAEISQAYEYFLREASQIPIIYGGSVNRYNVSHLTKIPNVGGILVGNASLDPQHFMDLISAFE